MWKWMVVTFVAGLTVVLASCGDDSKEKSKQPSQDESEFRLDVLDEPPAMNQFAAVRWQQKVAEDFGYNGPAAQIPAASRISYLDQVLQGDGYEKALMGFNLYFLGRYEGSVEDYEGNLIDDLLRFPQAVSSVRALVTGQDPMTFFDFEQPLFVSEPSTPFLFEVDDDGNFVERTPEEIRALMRERLSAHASRVKEVINSGGSKEEICAAINPEDGDQLGGYVGSYGLPGSVSERVGFVSGPAARLNLWCNLPGYADIDPSVAVDELVATHTGLMDYTDQLVAEGYQPKTLAEFKTIDVKKYGLEKPTAFTLGFFQDLPNSSTNYNRRRAAYVLKRYFCDDLTPINQVLPETHGDDAHAADPGCQSCHYKLDPLAGFFRNHGVIGIDFSELPFIFFDDGAQFDREPYVNTWQGRGDDPEAWNVGYVRSATDAAQNQYGETPEDLFNIIRNAPETKMCMIERMFDYFVDEDQTIDPGYVAYLANQHATESESYSPAEAYQRLLKRVLLSSSYSHPDRQHDECYDYAPGPESKAQTPCQISYIIEENCISCHAGEGAQGGLDLAIWQPGPDGTPWFKHQTAEGVLDSEASRAIILDRLTTPDPALRMPLDKTMPAADAETLFLWFSAESPVQ